MPLDEVNKAIRMDDKSGIVYIEYTYQQIGLTEEWFDEISKKIGNPLTVRREILLQRIRGSSQSPYPRDDIEAIINKAKRPIETIMLNKYYRLEVYEKLSHHIPYLVGIDCSTGTVKDNNAMTIINPYTLKVVAEFRCSYVGEIGYFQCILELVTKHIPRAILCVERNHVGDAIIELILQSRIAGRLYFDKAKELAMDNMKDLEEGSESMLKARAKLKTYYGVYTEGENRKRMFAILANHVQNHKDDFVGQFITDDIAKLIQTASGKIEARSGEHDDNVMSYLIALVVYYHGNNLEVFGFSKGDLLVFEEKNTGLHTPSEVEYMDLPDPVKVEIRQEIKNSAKPTYNDILGDEMMHAQIRDATLVARGLIDGPKQQEVIGDEIDFFENQDLSFFDDLNGF